MTATLDEVAKKRPAEQSAEEEVAAELVRQAKEVNYSYNSDDQLQAVTGGNAAGTYAYDADGNTLSGGGTTYTWTGDDRAATITTGGTTDSYVLDPQGQTLSETTSKAGTTNSSTAFHYGIEGGGDPTWTATTTADGTTTMTRDIDGPGGLIAEQTIGGATTFPLPDMDGSTWAQTGATGQITATEAYDEYGNPQTTSGTQTASQSLYGWLGNKQRATDPTSGLIVMGQRLYQPSLGRFLSVDPAPGGSANDYDYASQDPINNFDLNGQWCIGVRWHTIRHAAGRAFHQGIRVAATLPYGVYYGSYRANRWISHRAAYTPLSLFRPAFWTGQAVGLGGDAGLDWVKGHTGFHESIYDEHQYGHLNPLHSSGRGNTWLPGLYKRHGHVRVDWAW